MAINKSRRLFILTLCSLPVIGRLMFHSRPVMAESSGDEYVVVKGWILKKTDLYES